MNIVILDIDGTLTDGKLYYSSEGVETKSFCVKDGMALNYLVKKGIRVIVITGRSSPINERRCSELGISELYQEISDKCQFLINLGNVNFSTSLYIGDDINDIAIMQECAFCACPKDAAKEVTKIVDFHSDIDAGNGAVRDIIEQYFEILPGGVQ